MNRESSSRIARAPARPHGAAGLAGCMFCLTLVLILLQVTGSAPFVMAWLLGVLAW